MVIQNSGFWKVAILSFISLLFRKSICWQNVKEQWKQFRGVENFQISVSSDGEQKQKKNQFLKHVEKIYIFSKMDNNPLLELIYAE